MNNNSPDDKLKNSKREDVRPEREKGASPPDYMPSIFGWISMEEQEEHAREIADFTKDLKKNKKKK